MLKKLHVLLLVLLAAVCFTATAWADYDYIEQYGVMVTPNTEDGSLLITVKLEWTPLEELPYGQELKIGVPNGSIRDVAAQTDNIERLDFDNSYMYVYLTQGYDKDETFSFAYSWVQEYMYQLDGSAVTYDYTPGWFDEARIGQMTLIWNDPAGLTGDFTEGTVSGADSVTVQNGMTITASDLDYGYKMNIQVRYTDWPTQLSEEYSADNLPSDYDHCVYVPCEHFEDDTGDAIIGMMVTIFVVIFILVLISAARRGSGYAGGFGTRYVFVNHLWYPAGPDGRPRPGSVGTKTKPRPPRSGGGGFGGGSRGGGFGGDRGGQMPGDRQPLRLRQQLRLCVRLCLCRRRPRRLLGQEPLRRGPGRNTVRKALIQKTSPDRGMFFAYEYWKPLPGSLNSATRLLKLAKAASSKARVSSAPICRSNHLHRGGFSGSSGPISAVAYSPPRQKPSCFDSGVRPTPRTVSNQPSASAAS